MLENIFISSYGNNILTTIGFLSVVDTKFIKRWNVIGNSSLILLLRNLGMSLEQMRSEISNFDICLTMIDYFSVIPHDDDSKMNYVRDWILEMIRRSGIFKEEVTLKELFKFTGIFSNFISWNTNSREIVSINFLTQPETKLVDAVMSTLPCTGVFSSYTYSNYTFGNLQSIIVYPEGHIVMDKDKSKNLAIINNTNVSRPFLEIDTSPLAALEKGIIDQFLSRIEKFSPVKSYLVKIFSSMTFEEVTNEKKMSLYQTGRRQGESYLRGTGTRGGYINSVNLIKNQT